MRWLSGSARLNRVTRCGVSDRRQLNASPAAASDSTATAAVAQNSLGDIPEGRVMLPLAAVAVANVGFTSASLNVFALSNRSAGTFSSALLTAETTLAGTERRRSFTGRAGSVMIFMITACAELATCGGSPASISYSTAPNEYTSDRGVRFFSA